MKQSVDTDYLYSLLSKRDKAGSHNQYVKFADGVNVTGNEQSREFRDTLVKQFIFHYLRSQDKPGTVFNEVD
jgi:hypothetical protein